MSELAVSQGRLNPARVYLAQLSPRGRRSAACQLRNVAEILTGTRDLDAMDWSTLSRPAVIAIAEYLRRQGKAPTTINHCLSIVKRVAEEAWGMGYISSDAYQQIAKVRSVSGSRLPAGRAPSREEVRQAVDKALRSTKLIHLRDAAVIATLAGAGLRCFELVGLQADDYREGRLKLTGKGGKQALQPVSPSSSEVLEEYLEALGRVSGPMFVRWRRYDSPGLTPLSESGVSNILRRWMTGVSPHDLRRSYATWLAEDGHHLSVIQRLMRHSNPSTTMRYIRNEDEQLAASNSLRF